MAGWDEILKEITDSVMPIDAIRRKYLANLYNVTHRNIIAYYSAFLSYSGQQLDIRDDDMNGFMTAVHKLNCKKGLDLILHTPGGSPGAAEGIISYLRAKFDNDIRIIVPQLAMSAGTLMACAGKEIIMGRHSSLGPIDPQFNGIPAYSIIDEFNEAKKDLAANPANFMYWKIKLEQYPAAFVKMAIDAIDLSSELATEWLNSCMFKGENEEAKIKKIVERLNEHKKSKIHGRHFDIDTCKNMGLKIVDLEKDSDLQDAVLSVHHAFMITFNRTNAAKIIENHEGRALINTHN